MCCIYTVFMHMHTQNLATKFTEHFCLKKSQKKPLLFTFNCLLNIFYLIIFDTAVTYGGICRFVALIMQNSLRSWERRQLDFLKFLEEITPLIQEASSDLKPNAGVSPVFKPYY